MLASAIAFVGFGAEVAEAQRPDDRSRPSKAELLARRGEQPTPSLEIDSAALVAGTNGYVGLTPERLLDSRPATQVGSYSTPWGPGITRLVQVGGVGSVPASGVDAVALHITSVGPSAPGTFLTVFPGGETQPGAASMNVGSNAAHAAVSNNLIVAKLNSAGEIDIFNNSGTVDLVIDVVGYFATGGSTAGFVALTPERLLDSRPPTQVGGFATPWGPGITRRVQVGGVGSVPASGVDTVALHITSVGPSAPGTFVTVFPGGETQPGAASMNVGSNAAHVAVSNNLVFAKLNSAGEIDIFNNLGTVDLVIDVVGYYSTNGAGSGYVGVVPERLLDSRPATQVGSFDTPWGAETRRIAVSGEGPVPASGVDAVALHVTSVGPTAPGTFLTVFPGGETRPGAASMNVGTNADHVAVSNNLVIAKLNSAGEIDIFNNSGTVDLVIDVVGYFADGDCSINATLVTTVLSQVECDALVALYQSTDGDNWDTNTGWMTTTDPCTWYKVTCRGGTVAEIWLNSNNLVGTLPTELGNLTGLTHIAMEFNDLSGSIPSSIGNLTSLVIVALGGNDLTGTLPAGMGSISTLTKLWFDGNQLSGPIPTWLGNLTNLTVLDLDFNQFDGAIPTELGNLTNLTSLWLGQNDLTGTLPASLGNLTQLEQFAVDQNELTGDVTAAIDGMRSTLTLVKLADGAFGNDCFTTSSAAVETFLDTNDPGWDLCDGS